MEHALSPGTPAAPATGQPAADTGPQHGPAQSARPARRTRARRVRLAAGFLVVAAVGYGAGQSGQSGLSQSLTRTRATLSATRSNLAATRQQLSAARGSLTAAQSKATREQATARQATQTADTKARARYASAMAALKQQQRSLTSQEQAVKAERGQLQASAISSSGVYIVGQDIKSGLWHTNGDGGMTDNECYYATLNSTNTFDIADNNNFDGAETVNVSGAYALEISGPCTWYYAS